MLSWLNLDAPGTWQLLIGLTAALLVLGYFLAFARAMAPRRGTLEWIAMYDRPPFSLSGSGFGFRQMDLAACLLPVAVSAGLYLLAVCLQLRSFVLFTVPEGRLMLFGGALLFALSAAGAFALLRSLCGSMALAMTLALLPGLEYAQDYIAAAATVWQLFFLHRWCRANYEAPACHSFGWLTAFLAAALLAARMEPATVLFTAGLAPLVPLVLALRFHGTHRADRGRQLLWNLLFLPLMLALLLLAARVPDELSRGNAAFLADPGFYRRALLGFCDWSAVLAPPGQLLPLTANQLTLWGGLGAVVASLWALIRRGRPEGLLLIFGTLGAALLWLLGGVWAPGAVLTAALGCVFRQAWSRGARGLVLGGILAAFAATVLYDLALLGVL